MEKYQYHIFSPYRVCPLGAHVDHQHGLVTGFAIDKGVDLYFDVRGQMEDVTHMCIWSRGRSRERWTLTSMLRVR